MGHVSERRGPRVDNRMPGRIERWCIVVLLVGIVAGGSLAQSPVYEVPAALVAVPAAQPAAERPVGIFSDMAPGGTPEGWKQLRFPSVRQETEYSLVEQDGRVVLQSKSVMSASALITQVTVDPGRHPYLHWSWKTREDCFSGSWRRPESDDFPLRLFVIFERSRGFFSFFRRFGSGFPGDAILYVADATAHQAGERSSHVSGRIKVVPLEGPGRAGRVWGQHVRDVRADYVELFGHQSTHVAAIAVMTDTDNSRTACVSFFGDIYFSETTPERAHGPARPPQG